MKRYFISIFLLIFLFFSGIAQIKVDPSQKGRMFEGIGALSAGASSRLLADYPAQQQEEIFDMLFKPKWGASLQHFKVEIGGDVNSTSGTEPSHRRTREETPDYNRGYEWLLMKEAKKRNPAIFLECLEWGAPGWIGDGNFYSDDNIEYKIQFIKGAKEYHGLNIDYIGIWNERMHDVEYIKRLKAALGANELSKVKIVGSDLCCRKQWTVAKQMADDPQLMQAVDVIGDHYPERDNGYDSSDEAKASGKPIWNAEGGPWKGTWEGFAALAKIYNRDYIIGRMTKTITWSLITSYYENLSLPNSGLMKADSPWSGYYEVEPALWAAAHTTQFAEPGWNYIDQACGMSPDSTISYVALVSPDGKDFSIIIESIDLKSPQTLTFELPGKIKQLYLWRSVFEKESFIRQPNVKTKNGIFSIKVEPGGLYSLTTTTGQSKGGYAIKPKLAFPLPYNEDFESYAAQSTPLYISDQGGAFEVSLRHDNKGKSLRQVITRPAIEWEGAVLIQTVVGDEFWQDYSVSVDVFLEPYSYSKVSGRVTETHRSHKEPEGYSLRIYSNGNWELLSGKDQLVSGRFSHTEGEWHNVRLDFKGDSINGYIDDNQVCSITDSKHTRGMVLLGTSFHNVEFDNLRVTSK